GRRSIGSSRSVARRRVTSRTRRIPRRGRNDPADDHGTSRRRCNTAGSGPCGPGTPCAVSDHGPATDGDDGFPDQIPNYWSSQIGSFHRPSARRGASLQSVPRSADGLRTGNGESVNPVPPSLRRAKEARSEPARVAPGRPAEDTAAETLVRWLDELAALAAHPS